MDTKVLLALIGDAITRAGATQCAYVSIDHHLHYAMRGTWNQCGAVLHYVTTAPLTDLYHAALAGDDCHDSVDYLQRAHDTVATVTKFQVVISDHAAKQLAVDGTIVMWWPLLVLDGTTIGQVLPKV